jgi:peptidoglycan-N-acetylglucosamine deacetylase
VTKSRPVRLAATVAIGAATAQALPMITSARPLRAALWPEFSGRAAGTRPARTGHVALTFDDGPDPASTPLFLEALALTGTKATFFLLGSMLERAPELGRRIVAEGHEVAVHGWAHRAHIARSPQGTYRDVAKARDLVAAVTGATPHFYRPPYGVTTAMTLAASRRLGMRPVLWTAWGRDWTAKATPDSVFRTVVGTLRGGGTILLHDSDCTAAPESWRSTLGALPRLLEHCAAKGWPVGPLREHGLRIAGMPA